MRIYIALIFACICNTLWAQQQDVTITPCQPISLYVQASAGSNSGSGEPYDSNDLQFTLTTPRTVTVYYSLSGENGGLFGEAFYGFVQLDGYSFSLGQPGNSFTTVLSAGTHSMSASASAGNGATVDAGISVSAEVLTGYEGFSVPTTFVVSGGGEVSSGIGYPISLSSSQIGVTYQLQRDGVNVGQSVAGTGSLLVFGSFQANGVYTVVATNTCGSTTMSGSATIVCRKPFVFNVGRIYVSGGAVSLIQLNSSQIGVMYQLLRNNVNEGSPVAGTGGMIELGRFVRPGIYTVVASNVCGTTPMSGTVDIPIDGITPCQPISLYVQASAGSNSGSGEPYDSNDLQFTLTTPRTVTVYYSLSGENGGLFGEAFYGFVQLDGYSFSLGQPGNSFTTVLSAGTHSMSASASAGNGATVDAGISVSGVATSGWDVLPVPTIFGVSNGTLIPLTSEIERRQGEGTSTYALSPTENIQSTQWSLSPTSAGSINLTTGVVTWNATFEGVATIRASIQNFCEQTTERTLTVRVVPSCGLVNDEVEFLALKALYENTNGANWANKTGWETGINGLPTSENFKNWYGVSVDDCGDVAGLSLPENGLIGAIPTQLGQLTQLYGLNLSKNAIISLPATIGQLQRLNGLYVAYTQLTSVPAEIGQLRNLSTLYLQNNHLTTVPAAWGTQLTRLTELHLESNEITSLPVEFGTLPAVEYLYLGVNRLSALPSSFGGLTTLIGLDLSQNQFSSLPSTIGQLSNLRDLGVINNQLTTLPAEIGQLAALQNLYLTSNLLTALPATIGNLANLRSLVVGTNRLTSLPSTIGQLTNLRELRVESNQLTTLPAQIGTLASLQELYATDNQITGLPVELGQLTQLRILWVHNNQLSNLPKGNWNFATMQLAASTNKLDFEDLEPYFTESQPVIPASNFSYIDQTPSIGEARNLTISAGQTLEIPLVTGGVHNLYQWQKKDATGQWVNIAGATSATFTKTTTTEDAGVYRCVVTNSWVTNLALTSKSITVIISSAPSCGLVDDGLEFQALKALYLATNGAGWTNKTGWETGINGLPTSENFRNWSGVTVDQCGDVTRLSLGQRGLTGAIPAELGTLSKLQYLSFENSHFTNGIPPELGKLNNLEVLNLGLCHLTGNIPAELGNLEKLQELILYNNQLTGSIPEELGDMKDLQVLYLEDNLLASIPSQLGNLSKLRYLYIYNNKLTGSIPVEIGSLVSLKRLRLFSNQLSGSIPVEMGNLTNLEDLNLSNNQLSGSIPSQLGNLLNLVGLALDFNYLTGNIPLELSNLKNLTYLHLSNNQLTGSIPFQLSNATKLRFIDLSANQLIGDIPSSLGSLSNLTYLYLFDNQLLGTIPSTFNNLTQLEELVIHNNQLSGSLPVNLGNTLQTLSVHTNRFHFGDLEPYFTGAGQTIVPVFGYSPQAEIGQERNLTISAGQPLSIPLVTGGEHNLYQWQKKDATGNWVDIPNATSATFTKTAELSDVGVYRCVVTNSWVTNPNQDDQNLILYSKPITVSITSACGTEGYVPDETEFQALKALFEATNGYGGWADNETWIGTWNPATRMYDNGIYSTNHSHTNFKNWYGVTVNECGDVVSIVLPYNNLKTSLTSGNTQPVYAIPVEVCSLTELKELNLSSNTLKGSLPVEIGKLTKLENLNLASNEIEGNIPIQIRDLRQLQVFDLQKNKLTGSLPVEFSQLTELQTLDVWINQLSGKIPPELGLLTKLVYLDLSENQFSGTIPAELGKLTELTHLFLEKDQLTGQIPATLGALSKLILFHAHNNQLDDFPKWPALQSNSNVEIRVENNRLDFGDIEPHFKGQYDPFFVTSFTYAPQAEIGKIRILTVTEDLPLEIPLVTPGEHNTYQWQKLQMTPLIQWVNVTNSTANTATSPTLRIAKALPTDAGFYRCVVKNTQVTNPNNTQQNLILISKLIAVKVVPPTPICETTQPEGGTFGVNSSSGLIEFTVGVNATQSCATGAAFTCLSSGVAAQSRVVSTTATTFAHDWTTEASGGNPYEMGTAGKWRPLSTYAYNTSLAEDTENYKAGTFTATPFNWGNGNAQNWIPATTVTRYSDNGEASEERDVLGNYSCAKFGYSGSVPYLVAQNARYAETVFEGFESTNNNQNGQLFFEDQIGVQGSRIGNGNDRTAHSGKYCLKLTNGTFVTRPFTISQTLQERGLWCKVWIRIGDGRQKDSKGMEAVAGQLQLQVGTFTVNGFHLVAQTGEWSLCEALITKDNEQLPVDQSVTPKLVYTGTEELYIDDFRIQPADAQVMCYVYDESLRPVATFDDQHFALYYQYNSEGKLIRKLIETEKGVKTVQETQYNMPKVKQTE